MLDNYIHVKCKTHIAVHRLIKIELTPLYGNTFILHVHEYIYFHYCYVYFLLTFPHSTLHKINSQLTNKIQVHNSRWRTFYMSHAFLCNSRLYVPIQSQGNFL